MALPSNPPATTSPTALKTWMQNVVDTVTDHESDVADLRDGYTATGEQVAPDFKASGKTGATTSPGILAGGTNTGAAPTTGAHVVGEVVVGHDGKLWVCTTAGTPGTWGQVGGSVAEWAADDQTVYRDDAGVDLTLAADTRTLVDMNQTGDYSLTDDWEVPSGLLTNPTLLTPFLAEVYAVVSFDPAVTTGHRYAEVSVLGSHPSSVPALQKTMSVADMDATLDMGGAFGPDIRLRGLIAFGNDATAPELGLYAASTAGVDITYAELRISVLSI